MANATYFYAYRFTLGLVVISMIAILHNKERLTRTGKLNKDFKLKHEPLSDSTGTVFTMDKTRTFPESERIRDIALNV